MSDLLKLASKHKIEKHLFYGDALDRIYKTMKEHRMTRWLEQSCEQDLIEKLLWNKLITFLEKEVKIKQQKMMMLQRPKSDENQRESKDKNERSRYPINKSFLSGSESEVPICFICGARADHIATSGPGGSKVVKSRTNSKLSVDSSVDSPVKQLLRFQGSLGQSSLVS